MVNIAAYRRVAQGVFLFVVSGEVSICPNCGSALSVRSWRARMLIGSDGTKSVYQIRRLYCGQCRHLHHELPDCMVPYKRHCADTIEKAINNGPDAPAYSHVCDAPLDDRSLRRFKQWWGAVLPYFLNVLRSLTEKYKIMFNPVPAFKAVVRAAVNSGCWIFAHNICTRSESMSG
jgi:hypothetical protein